MNVDRSHLNAIEERLHRETMRLAASRTPREREFHAVQVAAAERELESEREFLGLQPAPPAEHMTDDELLAELGN